MKSATDIGASSPFSRAYEWGFAFATTPGRLKQFATYTLVSGLSLGLDLVVFATLMWSAAMAPALAGALSVLAGLILHYLLSVTVVFDAAGTGKNGSRLIGEYLLTGAMGFVITASVIFMVVDLAGLPAFLGKAAGIGPTFVSVYLVRAGYVFAPTAKEATKSGPEETAKPAPSAVA